jgi:regulation of enolase protein 1 (concanavalin A-like superfamily)
MNIGQMQAFLDAGEWLNTPPHHRASGTILTVQAARGSDFWRHTLYGFSRDSGHALLAPMGAEGSLEVTFGGNFTHLYDQAGLMLRTDEETWIKAGAEVTDEELHLAAVVTNGHSDWSMAPGPGLREGPITIRASWSEGSVTLRARISADSPWKTFRVVPFTVVPERARAGIFVCSPEYEGLNVDFSDVTFGIKDQSLHIQPD